MNKNPFRKAFINIKGVGISSKSLKGPLKVDINQILIYLHPKK